MVYVPIKQTGRGLTLVGADSAIGARCIAAFLTLLVHLSNKVVPPTRRCRLSFSVIPLLWKIEVYFFKPELDIYGYIIKSYFKSVDTL